MTFCLSLALLFGWVLSAQAQMDPTSAILLKSGSVAPREQVDSSRYTVRPKGPDESSVYQDINRSPRAAEGPTTNSKTQVLRSESVQIKTTTTTSSQKGGAKPATGSVTADSNAKVAPATEAENKDSAGLETENWKKWLLGLSPEEAEEYYAKIQPQDTRKNILELSPSILYFDNSSDSAYGLKDYSAQGAGLAFDANIWLSPFWGISADYQTSLVAYVPEPNGSTAVDYESFGLSVQFRKYSGLSPRSNYFLFGLGYRENNFTVPSDSTTVLGYKSAGFELNLDLFRPSSSKSTWQLGAGMVFKPSYQQTSNDDGANSGSYDDGLVVNLRLGQIYQIDRYNQIFWRVEQRLEMLEFQGPVSTADETGVFDENVSVTDSMTLFRFGYIWGN